METVLCRLCTDDFPVNFIEGYQRNPGSGQTAVLTLPGDVYKRQILGSGQPASPGETAAPVEYRMQTSASEPVQGNGKSTGYKAPVQGHFYQVVDQDGKDMIFATAQKKDVLAIATDSDFAMLTGKMVDIEALRKQGCLLYTSRCV